VQNAFRKDVCSLVNVTVELGNPFEEESDDLLVIDSKKNADPSAVEAVKKAQQINQQQFQTFTKVTSPPVVVILVSRLRKTSTFLCCTIHQGTAALSIDGRQCTASRWRITLTTGYQLKAIA